MIPRLLRLTSLTILLLVFSQCERTPPSVVVVEAEPEIGTLVEDFLTNSEYKKIPFAEVIEASTGKLITPFDPNDRVDRTIIGEIDSALTRIYAEINQTHSSIKSITRPSDLARAFEEQLLKHLQNAPGINCDYARTGDRTILRTGYPDLRLVHTESGKVVYLTYKLIKEGTTDTGLNSLHYTPKDSRSGKIHDDASHLLVGLIHDGNTGNWHFKSWQFVDLYRLKVQLMTEFQASNKDVYLPQLLIDKNTVFSDAE